MEVLRRFTRFLRARRPSSPVAAVSPLAEIEQLLDLAAAEASVFSVHEALPTLKSLAAQKARLVSAELDEHFGSLKVTFEGEESLRFAVDDLHEAQCVAVACRLSSPFLMGAIERDDAPGALLCVSAAPWDLYLGVKAVAL